MIRVLAAAALFALAAPPPAFAAPARPPPAEASPAEVTRAFYRALHAGDAAAAARLADGDARPVVEAFVRSARAHRDVEAALARRFGPAAAARVGYGNRVQSEVKALLGAEDVIEGDEAQVVTVDGRPLATLKRVEGRWKLELDDAVLTPQGQARVRAEARAAEAAAKTVVAGVRRGKYPDAGAAARDFQRRAGLPEDRPGPGAQDGGVDL
jgi:hypothetical protein